MRTQYKKSNNAFGLASDLSAKKGKIFLASGLIIVMVCMWVKVFTSDKTVSAAESMERLAAKAADSQKAAEFKLSYVGLDVVAGRNDVLGRDFFSADKWHPDPEYLAVDNDNNTIGQVIGDEPDDIKKIVKAIVSDLKLEAIITGQDGQASEAFIENRLVVKGSKLNVVHDQHKYELEVTEIGENQVVVMCEGIAVTLKMSQSEF